MNIKTFTIHSVRNVFAFFIALGLGYVAYTVSPSSVGPTEVEATSSENVSGYAWSDNIGWISFNDTTGGSAIHPYGVSINTTSGDIAGIAWSSGVDPAVGPQGFVEGGIGAISFNRADTGNPPGAPYQSTGGAIAKVNITTGAVTGWARALAVCTQDALGNLVPAQCAQNSNAGGWDGWIKLSKDSTDTGSTYGVTMDPNTGNFSGYAWGGAKVLPSGDSDPTGVSVIGWIKFAASGNVPAGSDDATCLGVTNNYSGTTKCTYGVKGPTLVSSCTSNFDCTGTKRCNIDIGGVCVEQGGTCSPGPSCGIGQSCNGSNLCVSPGGLCSATSECGGVQICPVGGGNCMNPGSCESDLDCTVSGQICNTSTNLCYNKPKTRFWQF